MNKEWMVDDINDLDKVSREVLEMSEEKSEGESVVLALHGDLGAGKTTFTKQLAKDLGIEETVTSPTYIIQKTFDIKEGGFKKLIHIDTYRIDLEDELIKLGWEDNLKDNNLVVVEWPENITDILPEKTIHIYFTNVDEITRRIEIRNE